MLQTFLCGVGTVTNLETKIEDKKILCKFHTGTVYTCPFEITIVQNGSLLYHYKSNYNGSYLFDSDQHAVFVGELK